MEQESIPDIRDVKDLKGKRVLLRASLNIPLKDGKLIDDFRVERSLQTIEYLQEQKARIIVMAHIGREPRETLKPIYERLTDSIDAKFLDRATGEKVRQAADHMHEGDVILLENLRQNEGETANDFRFAEDLASIADLYVNDAFADSHRAHASLVGVTRFLPSYAGILFLSEVEVLSRALHPEHPALFILGGAKFETKQPLIEKFLETYEAVFVGGALANDFYKAKEYEVGKSLLSIKHILIDHILNHDRLSIPVDVTVTTKDGDVAIKKPHEVLKGDKIQDCGPETLSQLKSLLEGKKFILWNGPLGEYQSGFEENTAVLSRMVAESGAHTVVGGGDTVALISKLGIKEGFTFCSTGGGAMLEFLMHGTLPAIEALKTCAKVS